MENTKIFMLAIKSRLPSSKYLCVCDCGNERIVNVGHFNTGTIKSCGCHVQKHYKRKTRAYASWGNMISRCHNKNNKRYKDYGDAGIVVCDSWRKSFVNFYNDMGDCPNGMQIDRKDNNGIYEPLNCHWVTPKENMANRGNSKIYIINKIMYSSSNEAAIALNVSSNTILAWCNGRTAEGRYYPPKKTCSVINKNK